MSMPVIALEVRFEADIVLARQRARQVAGLLGFAPLDQTRIATATSEIARNAFHYAGGGRVEFSIETKPFGLQVRLRERGQGMRDLQAIMGGEHESADGPSQGLVSARRLMDRFEIDSPPGGEVTVMMAKDLPKRTTPFTPQDLARISNELVRHAPQGLLEEFQLQNQELLRTLQELREQQTEIAALHARELDETNRGVLALYTELDENAHALRRISELKSRFLSNMSHEFRSPLNTILSLSGFLLHRSDGDLNSEQERQVKYIRKAAEGLATLINDLLDLAKVEAGRAVVRPEAFEVSELFDSLRGTIRPLLAQSSVSLLFEEPIGVLPLRTDEFKVGQILRNFLSNAVKFTERGEIRVSASRGADDSVVFSVADTGIGIAPQDWERVFEEFSQVEGPIQVRVKGTGLGLPLSRKLAELLGGRVFVRSEPGVGSTFTAVIPRIYRAPGESEEAEPDWQLDPARVPILVVDDDPVSQALYENHLEDSGFQVLAARTLDQARSLLRNLRPAAVILDILLEAESGWTLLTELKNGSSTRDIPVFVLTVVDGEERAISLGADEFCVKPIGREWLRSKLDALAKRGPVHRILIADDTEADRYLLRGLLSEIGRFVILESTNGTEAIRKAKSARPNVIFLDLIMPDMSGFEVLEHLRTDTETAKIPVIINTSHSLNDEERGRLTDTSAAILSKTASSRAEAFASVREALIRVGLTTALVATE